jgi:type II secretory pathway pseudopilin PulG
MPVINLLPKDLLPNAAALKTATLIKNLITLALAVFVIAVIGLVAYFSLNSLSIRNSNQKQDQLKNSIKSLEQTEQSLVLVKDRLTLLGQVNAMESGKEETANLSQIYSLIPAEARMSEAVIDKNKLDTTFIAPDTSTLSRLMASVVSATDYERVELLSFSFNPNVGFLASLSFITK